MQQKQDSDDYWQCWDLHSQKAYTSAFPLITLAEMKTGAFEVDDSILLVSANDVSCRSAVRTVWQDFPLVMKMASIPTISPN